MRIEQRSNVIEFFDLVELRRDQLDGSPLMIRETTRRGEWRVEARVRLVPVGLCRLHELTLIHTVGHRLADSVDRDEAWPTHAAALLEVRDIVPVLRAGAVGFGLAVDERLDVSAGVLVGRPRFESVASAAGRRIGAALAWCKREVA